MTDIELEQHIKSEIENNASYATKLAKDLNIPVSRLWPIIYKLGLRVQANKNAYAARGKLNSTRARSKIDVEKLKEYISQGMHLTEIASRARVGRGLIATILKENKIPYNDKPGRSSRARKTQLQPERLSSKQAAQMLHMSPDNVRLLTRSGKLEYSTKRGRRFFYSKDTVLSFQKQYKGKHHNIVMSPTPAAKPIALRTNELPVLQNDLIRLLKFGAELRNRPISTYFVEIVEAAIEADFAKLRAKIEHIS